MDTFLALLSSDKLQKISAEAFVVYGILRHDVVFGTTETAKQIKNAALLASGLSLLEIARRAKMAEITARRIIYEELPNLGWIRRLSEEESQIVQKLLGRTSGVEYSLGKISNFTCFWHVDALGDTPSVTSKEVAGSPPMTEVDKLRQMIAERKQRSDSLRVAKPFVMSSEAKNVLIRKVVGNTFADEKPSVLILQFFEARFLSVFKTKCLLDKGRHGEYSAKMYVFANRVYEACGGNVATAYSLISWYLDSWAAIQLALNASGEPSFNLLATESVLSRLLVWMKSGIPKVSHDVDGLGARASRSDISEAKDTGW
jgi:hypothetical protein